MSNASSSKNTHLPVSEMAENLIGSEIIKLAGEINDKIRQGEKIYNFTIGDFDPNLFPIPEELQQEIESQQAAAKVAVDGYEAELARLEKEKDAAIQWGQSKEKELLAQLEASQAEFTKCLALFHEAETTIEERTKWAQSLEAEVENLKQQLESIRGSKWIRLGRSIGLGPKVE